MAEWWAIGAPIVVFGSGLAVGVAGVVGSGRGIRWATQTAAVDYLAVVVLTPVAWTGVHTSQCRRTLVRHVPRSRRGRAGTAARDSPIVYLAVFAVAMVVSNTR